ncbi:MAG: hypothetical protein K1X74_16510 [Pirellulales bacterium]|nr:hypothetical protein [Pirellulales bacterium]
MAWLFEDPTTVLVAGALIEVLLAVVFFRTGRGAILLAMGAVAALVAVLLLVERLVVTPREQVEAALATLKARLEANDVEGVVDCLAPEAQALAGEARSRMPQVDIRHVGIAQLEIGVSEQRGQPAAASARFLCRVEGQDRAGQSPYDNFVRRFTVAFRHDGGRWLVTGYEDEDAFGPKQRDHR